MRTTCVRIPNYWVEWIEFEGESKKKDVYVYMIWTSEHFWKVINKIAAIISRKKFCDELQGYEKFVPNLISN